MVKPNGLQNLCKIHQIINIREGVSSTSTLHQISKAEGLKRNYKLCYGQEKKPTVGGMEECNLQGVTMSVSEAVFGL